MSTHSWNRTVFPDLIRQLVAGGADDRDKLHAALCAHFGATNRPWQNGKLATIDAWARLAAEAGAIELIAVGSRAPYRAPADSGDASMTVYRYAALTPGANPPPPKPKLRRAVWGNDVTPATVWQAVSDGAINRYLLADYINALLDGVCHPIAPLKAEKWAQYAGRAGAIHRLAKKAGEEPYIHRPGEYRMRFYRYAPGVLPEPAPVVPQGIDACGEILQLFNLIPAAEPPVGVGRVHLWDTDLEKAA